MGAMGVQRKEDILAGGSGVRGLAKYGARTPPRLSDCQKGMAGSRGFGG